MQQKPRSAASAALAQRAIGKESSAIALRGYADGKKEKREGGEQREECSPNRKSLLAYVNLDNFMPLASDHEIGMYRSCFFL